MIGNRIMVDAVMYKKIRAHRMRHGLGINMRGLDTNRESSQLPRFKQRNSKKENARENCR